MVCGGGGRVLVAMVFCGVEGRVGSCCVGGGGDGGGGGSIVVSVVDGSCDDIGVGVAGFAAVVAVVVVVVVVVLHRGHRLRRWCWCR